MSVSNFFKSVQKIWNRQTLADGTLFDEEFGNLYSNFDRIVDKGDLPVHNSTAGGASAIQITNMATGQTSTDGLRIEVDSAGEAVINQQENQRLVIKTNGSERVVITSDGVVKADAISEKSTGNKVIISNSKIISPTLLFKVWAPGTTYIEDEIVKIKTSLFQCTATHISGANFANDWLAGNCWVCIGDAPGTIKTSGGIAAEPGWFTCDGSAKSKTAYDLLWARLYSVKGTCTMTVASPCVVTFSNHGFSGGTRVYFTTSGTLPNGVSANTTYFVSYIDANTFKLSTTWMNYLNCVYVNSSGLQNGLHTLVYAPFGVADADNFYLPDTRGIFVRGSGVHGTMVNANSAAFAGQLGIMQNDKMHGHWHYFTVGGAGITRAGYAGGGGYGLAQGQEMQITSPITDSVNGTPRTGSETNPANIGLNYVIKY